MSTYTISDLQKKIDDFISEHGGYWPPLSMLGAITEELGELAREINYIEGYKPKKDKDEELNIGEEIADLIFALICLANNYNINLNTELKRIIEKYSKRDKNRFI